MSTLKKLKNLILVFALVGGAVVYAQIPQEMQQEQPKIEVNDAELEQFAVVFKDIMQKGQQANQEMVGTIEQEGMSLERYQELREADGNPDANIKQASKEEAEQKANIDQKIEEIGMRVQQEQTDIVEKSELSVDRYQEIAMALRGDQDLQQKLQRILMKNEENAND